MSRHSSKRVTCAAETLLRRGEGFAQGVCEAGHHFLRHDLPELAELAVPVCEQFGREGGALLAAMILDQSLQHALPVCGLDTLPHHRVGVDVLVEQAVLI